MYQARRAKYPGSHSYPNNETFTMRDPGMHEYLVRQFESVEERKNRKEKDPEVDTLGVKGRSYLFKKF